VRVAAAVEGIGATAYTAPYGQYFQEVLKPDSGLARFRADIVFLSLLLRQISVDVHDRFPELPRTQILEEKQRILAHIMSWIEAAKRATGALLLIANFPRPSRPALGIADSKDAYGEAEFYAELNLELLRALKHDDRAFLFDVDRLTAQWGARHALSAKSYYMAKMPWDEAFCGAVADEIVRFVFGATGRTTKCLVVDFDNTLWGGILGEDGARAVRIGEGDAEGEAYRDFQLRLRALKARGVVLAACSKNNLADVEELFETRPEMPLKKTDFAASQVGWEPKHVGLERIAEALNVGVDSLALVDDNPAEVMLVTNALPAVRTLSRTGPIAGAEALLHAPWLERLTLTVEDKDKAAQYTTNARRTELQRQAGDIQSYLAELRTELTLGPARAEDVPRVQQLFSKTNQFNVTTKR
jgi:HAD superfamily phosphatase (TIGR01681 family)